jgi:hypothetical protein
MWLFDLQVIVEAEPCVSCLTTGGACRNESDRPSRFNAAKFGVEGVLCQSCYDAERTRANAAKWDAHLQQPELVLEAERIKLSILSAIYRAGDDAEARRLSHQERVPQDPASQCAAILTDWRRRFGKPGREKWSERFGAAGGRDSRTCWMSNVEFARNRHGELSPEYRDALAAPATCLGIKGHHSRHNFVPDGSVSFEFVPARRTRGARR